MNELQPHALAARVVAWHNKNPLARRIRATEVHSVGYVAVPLLLPTGAAPSSDDAHPVPAADPLAAASLRERAMARIQKEASDPAPGSAAPPLSQPAPATQPPIPLDAKLPAAFGASFIAGLTPRAVAAWASQHGVALDADPAEAPVRRVAVDVGADPQRVCERWLLTAQVEIGLLKSRVLLGGGAPAAVLGRRLLSPLRMGMLLALVLVMALVAVALVHPDLFHLSKPQSSVSASVAASAPTSVLALLPSALAASNPGAGASAPETAAVASSELMASAPADVEPRLGRVDLPPLSPYIDEKRRLAQTRAASAAGNAGPAARPEASSAVSAQPAPPARAATPTSATAAATVPAPAPAGAGPAYAVSTQLLRTRTESEQYAAAMRDLLRAPGGRQFQVEVLAAGKDWRVVGWPYASQSEADRARALLSQRGMKVEVIAF